MAVAIRICLHKETLLEAQLLEAQLLEATQLLEALLKEVGIPGSCCFRLVSSVALVTSRLDYWFPWQWQG